MRCCEFVPRVSSAAHGSFNHDRRTGHVHLWTNLTFLSVCDLSVFHSRQPPSTPRPSCGPLDETTAEGVGEHLPIIGTPSVVSTRARRSSIRIESSKLAGWQMAQRMEEVAEAEMMQCTDPARALLEMERQLGLADQRPGSGTMRTSSAVPISPSAAAAAAAAGGFAKGSGGGRALRDGTPLDSASQAQYWGNSLGQHPGSSSSQEMQLAAVQLGRCVKDWGCCVAVTGMTCCQCEVNDWVIMQ